MANKILLVISIIALLIGLIFLMDNEFALTGGFVGVSVSSTVSSLAGIIFLAIAGVFYVAGRG
jgi:hypothetical protein